MFCRFCGNPVDAGDAFCAKCGNPTTTGTSAATITTEQIIGALSSSASSLSGSIASSFRPKETAEGVGGWLLLFCVLQCIVWPVEALRFFGEALRSYQPGELVITLLAGLLNLLLILPLALTSGIMLWKRRAKGLTVLKIYFVMQLILAVISFLADEMRGSLSNDTYDFLCLLWILTVIAWWLYFRKSIRVKNTYGRNL
jgi:hypothetical protein